MVIADASVLISLSSIQALDLLHERFPDGIIIPPTVKKEVVDQGSGRPGGREVAEAGWISVRNVTIQGVPQLLQIELEEGEVEVIALGYEIGADVVLLDERDARQAAKQLGLQVLGTIGILVWAKRNGLLPSLKDALDKLQTQAKFRVSQTLYERSLLEVGESK